MRLWWAIWMLLAAQLHLGAAQTAYVIPAMQQDNPSNHSYKRMSNIFQSEAVLQQYDVIAFVDDYRVDVSAQYISAADRPNSQITLRRSSIDLQHSSPSAAPCLMQHCACSADCTAVV
jgi:hypothetical protein